jgi:uncharacterized protein
VIQRVGPGLRPWRRASGRRGRAQRLGAGRTSREACPTQPRAVFGWQPRYLTYTYVIPTLELIANELIFDWDAANEGHVALHGVMPEEVEQVFANDPMDLDFEVVDGEERYQSLGHTNGLRILFVAWTMRGDAVRPITAFEASRSMAQEYRAYKGL